MPEILPVGAVGVGVGRDDEIPIDSEGAGRFPQGVDHHLLDVHSHHAEPPAKFLRRPLVFPGRDDHLEKRSRLQGPLEPVFEGAGIGEFGRCGLRACAHGRLIPREKCAAAGHARPLKHRSDKSPLAASCCAIKVQLKPRGTEQFVELGAGWQQAGIGIAARDPLPNLVVCEFSDTGHGPEREF